jgi:uncharacterized membrane protein YkvA (DUF1232 family)
MPAKKTAKKSATKKAAPRKKAAPKKAAPKRSARNVSASYDDAKKSFMKLWKDVAAESHDKFDSIAKNAEKKYHETRKKITETDVKVALSKAGGVAEKLLRSGAGWVRVLGLQVKLLYELLRDSVSKKFKVPWATVAAITAALLYVIMPIDLLPDFIPGVGYVDDALIVSMCISLVRIDLRRYARFRNLTLSQYGL